MQAKISPAARATDCSMVQGTSEGTRRERTEKKLARDGRVRDGTKLDGCFDALVRISEWAVIISVSVQRAACGEGEKSKAGISFSEATVTCKCLCCLETFA